MYRCYIYIFLVEFFFYEISGNLGLKTNPLIFFDVYIAWFFM